MVQSVKLQILPKSLKIIIIRKCKAAAHRNRIAVNKIKSLAVIRVEQPVILGILCWLKEEAKYDLISEYHNNIIIKPLMHI